MKHFREALRILMDSPLYWTLDYLQRLELIRRTQNRQSFIQAISGFDRLPVNSSK